MFSALSNLFRKPSARTLAQQSLEEAQRQALAYRSAAEYNARLSEYSDNLVTRLTAYLQATP